MKFKKLSLKALGLLMSVTLVAGLLSSCSKDGSSDKLVESIPSSAMYVVKFNPKQVVENAGCSVDNGKIVLSDKISGVIKEQAGSAALKVINGYLEYTEGMNLDAVMVFATSPDASDLALVATLSDPEPVKEHLKELVGKEKEEDGFTVYKAAREGVIAIKGNMLWVAAKLSVINKHIEKAAESNITSVKDVADVLTADNAFAYVVSLPKVNNILKSQGVDIERKLVRNDVPAALAAKIAGVMDYYFCGSMTFAGNSVSGEAFLVNEQGERAQFGKLFNEIDTDFLKNVPADANCIGACGNIADADVKALIEEAAAEVARQMPDQQIGTLVASLLTKWDGTAAAAFDVNALVQTDMTSLLSMSESSMMQELFENMKFLFMIHYPQDVVNNLTQLLYDNASAAGSSVNTISPNYYSASVTPDMSFYFGNLNGYFAFGNSAVKGGAQSLADKFAGKRFAIYSTSNPVPALARFGWDFGSEGEIWLDDDAVKFTVSLTGTSQNYLQAMIEPLTDMDNLKNFINYMNEIVNASYNSRYRNYYDYSPYDYDFDDYDVYDEVAEADYDEDYTYDI